MMGSGARTLILCGQCPHPGEETVLVSNLGALRSQLGGALVVVALVAACGPTSDEYAKFAAAGQGFNAALSSMAGSAVELRIQASNEELLQSYVEGKPNDVLRDRLKSLKEGDKKIAERMAAVRRTAAVMSLYFQRLSSLANSGAADEVAKSFGQLGDALEEASQALRDQVPSGKVSDVFSAFANVAVSTRIRDALREQLEKHKDTLFRIMAAQKIALELTAEQIATDQVTAMTVFYEREVRDAMLQRLIGNTRQARRQWSDDRLRALTQPYMAVASLQSAATGMDKMMTAFRDLLSDEITAARLEDLLGQAATLVALAKELEALQ